MALPRLDATYIKVRRSGRDRQRGGHSSRGGQSALSADCCAIACRVTDGRREVLGLAIQPSEAEVFWDEFLRSLADRGLRGVKLIITPFGHVKVIPPEIKWMRK